MRARLSILLAMALLAGCAERTVFAPEDVDVLVVDAVMLVGEAFPPVYLSRTADPREPATVDFLGERGAAISIEWGDETTNTMNYLFQRGSPGVYVPASIAAVVQPSTLYRLEVRTEAGEVLRAQTLTPPALTVDEWVLLDEATLEPVRQLATFQSAGDGVYAENQLVYAQGLFEARFDRPDVPAFQVGLFSLDPDSDFVIDPEFFEEEDFDDLDRIISTPVLAADDGRLRLPWFAIYFEGRYLIRIYALDRNWYDLARTVPDFGQAGSGFGGNAGDGFARPIFHVEGGIGIFGSASVSSNGFFILP